MQKVNFSIFINASREKVWDTMLQDATYREWTKAFGDSHYEGDWEQGSKISFIGTDEKGEQAGMVARIAESRKPEFVSIEYVGTLKNGVEDTEGEEAKKWAGAHENYTFTEKDGGTELAVVIDVDEQYAGMFNEMWPKALENLKVLAER
jgi:uncharacterized protein YndB with AHSA1/START domain